jgi:sporulation protein YlmC with PRC-barrel domain
MTPVIQSEATDLRFNLEELLGVAVCDRNGNRLGHIYELIAEERDGRYVIVEYLLGSGALLERIHISVRSLFGIKPKQPKRIPWEQLDLTDLKRPIFMGEVRREQGQ